MSQKEVISLNQIALNTNSLFWTACTECYVLPGGVDVENNKRDDGDNDVKYCVQPENVHIYIPVINPQKEFIAFIKEKTLCT